MIKINKLWKIIIFLIFTIMFTATLADAGWVVKTKDGKKSAVVVEDRCRLAIYPEDYKSARAELLVLTDYTATTKRGKKDGFTRIDLQVDRIYRNFGVVGDLFIGGGVIFFSLNSEDIEYLKKGNRLLIRYPIGASYHGVPNDHVIKFSLSGSNKALTEVLKDCKKPEPELEKKWYQFWE
jgi:hypothetical protein